MSQKPKKYKPKKVAKPTPAELDADNGLEDDASIEQAVPKSKAHLVPKIALFLLGFLLYANTIPFEHALDDKLLITSNEYTKNGIDGIGDILENDMLTGFYGKKKNLLEGGRFRPLAQITFALEYEFLGPPKDETDEAVIEEYHNSMAKFSHAVNALLYGLSGLVLYLVLLHLFPLGEGKKWWFSLPFIATVLWLAHPLHTEVVANIKSRDEIFSLLGALGATWYGLQFLKTRKFLLLIPSAVLLFMGMAGKESGIFFLGVIPLMAVFFTKAKWQHLAILMGVLLFSAISYLLIRQNAIGDFNNTPVAEWMNDPYLFDEYGEALATGEKEATISYTLGIYIKLLFVPIRLTHDYYPKAIEIVNWGDTRAIGPAIAYMLMLVFGLWMFIRRLPGFFRVEHDRQTSALDVYAFGILFYIGTFIFFSNFFVQIGTFMNERFMYVPSIGWAVIVAWLLTHDLKRLLPSASTHRAVGLGIAGIVVLLFAAKTIDRNNAWFNDESLSLTDVQTSTTSAKVNMSAGGALIDIAAKIKNEQHQADTLALARTYLQRSLEIYPGYLPPQELMGRSYFYAEDYSRAIDEFEKCLKQNPNFAMAVTNLEATGNRMRNDKNYELAIKAFTTLLKYKPKRWQVMATLGEMYGKEMNNLPKAIEYLEMAYALIDNIKGADAKTNVLNNLGTAYAFNNQLEKAVPLFEASVKIKPKDVNAWSNLAKAYQSLGMAEQFQEAQKQVQALAGSKEAAAQP